MATLIGSVYKRVDSRFDSRLRSRNGRIVGTSGSQGYQRRRGALKPLRRLLECGPHIVYDADGHVVAPDKATQSGRRSVRRPYTGRVYQRKDGRWEWRIKLNGRTVYVSHDQGYERAGAALRTLVLVCHGGPHTVVE